MKKVNKIIALTTVAVMTVGCLSASAMPGKMGKNSFKTNPANHTIKDGNFKGGMAELTEEEKAAKIEELKADLAKKLEEGKITQEQYDEFIAKIESGEFKLGGFGRGKMGERKERPERKELTEEEKAAKIEELKADLAKKLEDGKITQEQYDEAVAKIENGEFKLGGFGRGKMAEGKARPEMGERKARPEMGERKAKPEMGQRKERPERKELTEEEKAAKIEELKADLAKKLEEGKITQEQYDELIAKIESGEFKLGGFGMGMRGGRNNASKPVSKQKNV